MLEFTLQKDQLSEAIAKLGHIMKGNKVLPILDNIYVVTSKKDVTFTTTDLNITIRFSIESVCSAESEFLVPFAELKKIAALESGEIHFTIQKNKEVWVSCNKDEFCLGKPGDVAEYPAPPKIAEKRMFEVNGTFLPSLSIAALGVGTDDMRPSMMNVCAIINKNGVTIASTDANSLYVREIPATIPIEEKTEILIPPVVAKALEGFTTTKIGFNNNHVAFESGQLVVYCKMGDAKFPNFRDIIPEFTPKVNITLDVITEAIDKMMVVSEAANSTGINFTISDKEIQLKSESIDKGMSAKCTIGADSPSCETGEIRFNGKLFSRALRQLAGHGEDKSNIKISLSAPNKAALLRIEGKDDLTILIMPITL